MDVAEAPARLEVAGTEQNRTVCRRHGATDPLFGVSFAVLSSLPREAQRHGAFVGDLWATGNPDLRPAAEGVANRIGLVAVDHGWTGCVTPAAIPCNAKARARRASKAATAASKAATPASRCGVGAGP